MIDEYYEEIERAKQPGYVSRYDDFDYEYSDAPRGRPARFDQPHASSGRSSRISARQVPTATKTRQRQTALSQQPTADGSETRARRRHRGNEGFGAGIFPGIARR